MQFNIFGYDVKIGPSFSKKGYGTPIPYTNLSQLPEGFKISPAVYFSLYKKNTDIRQCVAKIAQAVSRNGIYLVDNNNGEVVENPLLTDEIFTLFNTPTFLYFKRELYKQYLIGGELYIVPIEDLKQQVVGFEILDMKTMSIIYDTAYNIIGYRQTNNKGLQRFFSVDKLAYFKFENDTDESSKGMGLISSVVYDALSDVEATKRNYMFFENGATGNQILILNDNLSEAEQKIAKEMFDRQYKGVDNAFKTMLAGGIKEVKEFGMSHKDMDFINQRKLTTDKVSALFGVPKSILGYTESVNYSNAITLRSEYIEGTIRAYEWDFKYIVNILLNKFIPKLGEKYTIMPDGETVTDVEGEHKRDIEDVQNGLRTINEVRKYRGADEYVGIIEADRPIINRNMSLLEDITINPVIDLNENKQ